MGKGVIDHEYGLHTIKAVVEDLNDMGFKRIIFKTDQEPAAKALQRRVKETWSGEVVVQNSPVGSSQSNGLAEKGVQEVEGQARTLKIALEGRLKVNLPSELPVMMWLIEHAGDLMNRFRVGSDGRTPRERNTGKADSPTMAEFGESILFLPMDRDRGPAAELDSKFMLASGWALRRRPTKPRSVRAQASSERTLSEGGQYLNDDIKRPYSQLLAPLGIQFQVRLQSL